MSSSLPARAINKNPPNQASPASIDPNQDKILQQMMQTEGCCIKAQELHQSLTSYLLGCTTKLYHIDNKSPEQVKEWDEEMLAVIKHMRLICKEIETTSQILRLRRTKTSDPCISNVKSKRNYI